MHDKETPGKVIRESALPTSATVGTNKDGEWMTVAPDEVAGRTFSVVEGGYDRAEVDEFLNAIAVDYKTAVVKIGLAAGVALDPERIGREIEDILVAARNAAERTKANALEEADKLVRAATVNKQETDREVEEITRATKERLVAATTEAERIEAEAQQNASRKSSKEIEHAEKYARELRESAESRANEVAAEMKRRDEEQQLLVEEMLSRIGKVDTLMQRLKAHFELPDLVDSRDPKSSDKRESARDIKGP